jgi:glycosyltransferase involved in cell wall biosynthesis
LRKRVTVSVINDLVTDQRVKRTCQTLTNLGFDILLIGRRLNESLTMEKRPYKIHRMKLLFTHGPLFYMCFNLRLFFLLLFHKSDLLLSNDLDTLLPNYLVSKIKGKPLIYDSHEYFTEVPELVNRKGVQKIWKRIEKWIFPKLVHVITVNESIADLYENEYGIRPVVVRNIPSTKTNYNYKSRAKLGLPENKSILILQGSGINIQRGAEEMVEAMQYINNAVLLIVGGGDVVEKLKLRVSDSSLSEKVIFRPKLPYDQLINLTYQADLGLTLDKDTNLNYRYSLPNKLFDYIQAGTPVIASPLVEIKKIIEQYDIGDFIPDHDPKKIADKVNTVLNDKELIARWEKNINFAASQLTWENEEQVLKKIFAQYV